MDRRRFLNVTAAASAAAAFTSLPQTGWAAEKQLLTRKISSTGETIPILGMGTWITFNVGKNKRLREKRE